MTDRLDLEHSLNFAVKLAREAGQITLKYFQQSLQPDVKADGSFVTAADREAEHYLRSAVLQTFPDDSVLGEEDGESQGTSGRRWIVDPIDGTFSFVHGVPFYGVLIGLEINNEPSVGVVNMPALGEMVYAARGLGCFWNGNRTKVSATNKLQDALLLATDFGVCEQYGFGEIAGALERRVMARRTWGDCYGHLLVATGRAEVMLDPVMNIWDCAALMPIVSEAGGTFTDWSGKPTISGGNAISTNGVLLTEVMKIIENRTETRSIQSSKSQPTDS